MTTSTVPLNDDIFGSDEGRFSPLMKPINPKIRPSPTPPPNIPIAQVRASQGDAVLVSFLDDGRRPEIASLAGVQTLPSDNEDDDDDDDSMTSYSDPGDSRSVARSVESPRSGDGDSIPSLQFLAAGAVAQLATARADGPLTGKASPVPDAHARYGPLAQPGAPRLANHERPIRDERQNLAAPPVAYPPHDVYATQNGSLIVKSPTASGHGDLAPLQNLSSPKPDINGHGPLPSLASTFGDIKSLGPDKDTALRHRPPFPRSPNIPRLSMMAGNPASPPPISPNEPYRREPPSPAQSMHAASQFYFANGSHPRTGTDYSSSATATPSSDSIPTPATSLQDRISIDGITHPQMQMGTYVCTVAGCTAPPFQTQYLLNSHANVHSSARPHYCSVAGCPRSEGGKGFKRKNEMIRHGLVHDSPGYVCPFCPDREHKYPRPDNLQRHVRVHHVDKDKDDPMLREVLSQRPDGPNRGRRRRGVPVS